FEDRQHLCQSPPTGAENDPKPRIDDPDSRLARRGSNRLPVTADIREKSFAAVARFGEDFVTPVAVDADRRGAKQRRRSSRGLSQRFAQEVRAADTAVANAGLLRGRPAPRRDRLSSQMDNRIQILQTRSVDVFGFQVPAN